MGLTSELHQNGQRMVLLPPLTISGAVAATVTSPVMLLSGMRYVIAEAKFLFGAGGTSVKAYIQTSIDGGLTWIDVIAFAFTGTAGNKVSAVSTTIALAAAVAPTDGTLTDNTIVNGLLGDRIRLKYVTTGDYTGATSLAVYCIAKG